MTKPIIVVKVPCKLLYVIQVKEFLIKCSTSWPYLISEFLVAYITIVASDWPRTFFTPKVFLFSIDTLLKYICILPHQVMSLHYLVSYTCFYEKWHLLFMIHVFKKISSTVLLGSVTRTNAIFMILLLLQY